MKPSSKFLALLFTTSLAASSCSGQKNKWTSIFDGKTMNGWRTFKNEKNDSWEVKDGTLHCRPTSEAKMRADLITEKEYENFELSLEWKISATANSGILFRVSENYEHSYQSGPEYQVLDDEAFKGKISDLHFTGTNFDMHSVTDKKLNVVGEWNTSQILVNKNHVEHWLNGEKILEYEIDSEDWLNKKNNSKWKEVEGYAVPRKGFICLQDHNGEVWYKKIKIRIIK